MSEPPKKTRTLSFWGAIALSLSIMAPTMAMSLNGALPASMVGASVPLTFLLSFVGVALVAYSFVRLTGRFNHAGSVYALAGATIGPRAGFFSGWGLLGVYFAFIITTVSATVLFLSTLLTRLSGVEIGWGWLAAGVVLALLVLTTRDVRAVAHALIGLEVLSVGLVVVVLVVVTSTLLRGEAPEGQTFSATPLTFGEAGMGAVFATTVFGFLSWAGFEGAATLGEETNEPRRNIPRAIWVSVTLLGIFYTLTMYVQISGFGTDAAGVEAFASSGGTLADLAQVYISDAFGTLVNVGAVASAFACAAGCTTAASRMLFAMGRDGFGPRALGVRDKHEIPRTAVITLLAAAAVTMALISLTPGGTDVTNQFFWSATLGSLILIPVYGMTNLALLVQSVRRPAGRTVMDWLLPGLSLAFLGYVFWENRGNEPPYDLFPYGAAAWLLVGLLIVSVLPGLTSRIGANLTADEGLAEPAPVATSRGSSTGAPTDREGTTPASGEATSRR